jgi:hypothetical protein
VAIEASLEVMRMCWGNDRFVNNDGDGVYLDFAAGGLYFLDFGDELGASEGQCSISATAGSISTTGRRDRHGRE